MQLQLQLQLQLHLLLSRETDVPESGEERDLQESSSNSSFHNHQIVAQQLNESSNRIAKLKVFTFTLNNKGFIHC